MVILLRCLFMDRRNLTNRKGVIGVSRSEIFRYISVYSSFGDVDEISISLEEEGFVVCADGRVQTLLSGEKHIWNPRMDKGIVIMQTEADANGVAGTGGIKLSDGKLLGGWCSFSCRLLSPKRFVIQALELLIREQRIQSILTETVRGSIHTSFIRNASVPANLHLLRRTLWTEAKTQTKTDLLRMGWQMTDFHMEHLQIKQEGFHDEFSFS